MNLSKILVVWCIAAAMAIGGRAAMAQQGNPATQRFAKNFPWHKIEEERVAAAGIRKLESRRLVLYTDLPSSPEVDELPEVFDQAFELWCQHFGLNVNRYPNWRMRASLIADREKFVECGLIPHQLPEFLNGYTKNLQCWLNDQSSDYYRRHLLLHEGMHGFMFTLLGNRASPWYVEGMAEFLATHRWEDKQLKLPYYPRGSSEVPKLGRVEIVQTDFARGRAPHFHDLLAYENSVYLDVRPYGWSWAAAAFLDNHPRYRDRFRKSTKLLQSHHDFNQELRKSYGESFPQLVEEWQVFVSTIDYGYDFDRTIIDFKPGKPIAGAAAKFDVQSDRGWQNSGVRLEAGRRYKLKASGRYQVASEVAPWISEPQGISIRYVNGRPIGQLLAVVRPERAVNGESAFLHPIAIGASGTLSPAESGTLYLKVNDSAGALGDNKGQAEVEISVE